ncbi:hypothetical protein BWD42_12990 [Sphingobacterium sp. CZ-UAM]|uniref:helix-turn-helix domain-containing protein n=1 Tax=Sphingobacterium sp. CZ-UAM TaxID=1933868 RepID=UPI0009877251|nr:helix-turn-helix domain-containing protein [Sphingobacterium sp. CZ-UAM]OOG18177.1 hypothetical protein BWD42_12990 [Sphingobacterium sp. CZ-UAM]
MGAIQSKIKRFREAEGMTQQEMADNLHIHVKTWQKIENGITRLDLDRLKQIANVYDIPVEDLINTDDSIYISEIKDNKVGFNNSHVTINDKSENEIKLYEKLLEEKDRTIEIQSKLIAELEEKLRSK